MGNLLQKQVCPEEQACPSCPKCPLTPQHKKELSLLPGSKVTLYNNWEIKLKEANDTSVKLVLDQKYKNLDMNVGSKFKLFSVNMDSTDTIKNMFNFEIDYNGLSSDGKAKLTFLSDDPKITEKLPPPPPLQPPIKLPTISVVESYEHPGTSANSWVLLALLLGLSVLAYNLMSKAKKKRRKSRK